MRVTGLNIGREYMNIKCLKLAIIAAALVLTSSVNAAIITVGNLATNDDGSSNIITDSLNNVEYLRLDVLADLTYAETLSILDTQDGGGWSIANYTGALAFSNAALNGDSVCTHTGVSPVSSPCGLITGWTDGNLGNNHTSTFDFAWFLDDNGDADSLRIESTGQLNIYDYGSISASDEYAASGRGAANSITWLVTRPAVVPVPAAIWLFGSGLLGLIGIARRKKI